MNKSQCDLGALVSSWLKEYHQSFFFDQAGRWWPEATLVKNQNFDFNLLELRVRVTVGEKMVILFDGRDAPAQGGTIRRVTR